jgi:hypothetical protein
MAETIVRLIGALILAAFELLVQHTGKKALSLWGRKSNPFIELLIGLVIWSIAGLMLVALLQRSRQNHDHGELSLQSICGCDRDVARSVRACGLGP